MRNLLGAIRTRTLVTAKRGRRRFRVAVSELSTYLAAPPVRISGTSVWVFGKPRAAVLRWVRAGGAEFRIRMQRGESFVVLGLEQVAALFAGTSSQQAVGELLARLPLLPASMFRPARRAVRIRYVHRVPK